ncbi:MAG: imidazole glycerol phosphate synthase subunit HisH [Proteobacteria bacterium]|nr:imidazole glycerol phosphate synthase subunit HisH [Pseudomonadota bacterium]MBU4384649.1 imidazole glycerol phosphate synthase subunit HisH [Pseudomonadota bacterium]MCG2766203.1 imidazole glycerol phosphate synthase subunit HisH [Desulfarculaceae bacterium]
MIVIIDYGLGNLRSILNMLEKLGVSAAISNNIEEIEQANRIILPGVGAFDTAMNNINKLGLLEILNQKVVKQKTPILGICLGMQLLAKSSQEGKMPGLGWVDAEVVRFSFPGEKDLKLKIPHMGWNEVEPTGESHFFPEAGAEYRYYFVHSYYMICKNHQDSIGITHHGLDFTSVVMRENILGFQFHPEKSHKFGIELLKRFTTWDPGANR